MRGDSLKKYKKTKLIIIATVSLVLVLLVFRFGTALVQEKNPIPILTSILFLELSENNYKNFSTTDKYERFVSKNIASEHQNIISTYMKEKRWIFNEQFGSGLIFVKDGKELIINTELYSENYLIWNVPKEGFEEHKS